MVKAFHIIDNEEGSTIVFALLILVVLTILGISATTTSTIEFKIVHNEKSYQRNFYVADSAWNYGAYWLEVKSKPPDKINTNTNAGFSPEQLKLVRNFGDGAADVLNDIFPDNTEDGTINSIPYWYNVQYHQDAVVPGSANNYREFTYIVKSNANKKQEIEVGLKKIYKVGY